MEPASSHRELADRVLSYKYTAYLRMFPHRCISEIQAIRVTFTHHVFSETLTAETVFGELECVQLAELA